MGVDISTYRCRVGQFVPHHGAGGMCIALNFSLLVKIIGVVTFIRILLIMAGIEQNPGPQDKFVFRYQYLLIEIGAKILREIFDVKVGRDFVKYLSTNKRAEITLKSLMTGKNRKITTDQEQLLPPIEKQPSSSSFDITLLSLLLRNVCGLRPAGDNVWINPQATDHTLEADITRLRKCRNQIMHIDKLRITEKELNDHWQELDEILNRLNVTAGLTNLSKLINDAKHMDIDEELKERYIETIKAWVTLDCSLDEVKEDISLLKRNQSELDTRVGAVEEQHAQRQRVDDLKDTMIQQDLIEFYKRRCNTLQVSPLFDDKDKNILKIYKRPTMYSVDNKTNIYTKLTFFKEIFCKDDKSCNQIYIIGDAGMGKTSLCTFMCSLWCIGRLGDKLEDEHKELQKDVEYMSKFDLVFYLNLRDTEAHDVIDMLKEQYLRHHDPLMIQDVLRKQRCLILMDGLDEWQPKQDGKKKYKLPERLYSDNCVYMTTSRPYRIESERLPSRDVDHRIHITGIEGEASESYVRDVVEYMNEINSTNRDVTQFMMDIDECGLWDQLCIPMIASHLVLLWFETKLTAMPRALIYANILEMLFRRAKKRDLEFPPPAASTWQLPASFCELEYLNKYVSLLHNVCNLAFRSLFKQCENVAGLVFTRQQLQAEPYCFSIEETDFLCKIGILSKNEIFGCYSVEKLKVSFIHKSYVEFFASVFTSLFDKENIYSDATKSWKTLNDVIQFENFFLLLSGLSYNKVKYSMENVYLQTSEDLAKCRKHYIVGYDSVSVSCATQIKHLQKIVINCYKEVSRSNFNTSIVLKLEDFVFDSSLNDEILKHILLLNKTRVSSIKSCTKYWDEFNQINDLQYLWVYGSGFDYDVRFTKFMVQNMATLSKICIEGYIRVIPELPLRNLHHLTSLSLCRVTMQHNSLRELVTFLSDNVLFENIKLIDVSCDNHPHTVREFYKNSDGYIESDVELSSESSSAEIIGVSDDESDDEMYQDFDCDLTLNLSKHTRLNSLYLVNVNILCHNVNHSSLKYIDLAPLSKRIALFEDSYIDLFNCLKDSQIEHLYINGYHRLDDNTIETLADVVKSLQYIMSLRLDRMNLPDYVLLSIHPRVTQDVVIISMFRVKMSSQCFRIFCKSLVNKKPIISVDITLAKIDMNSYKNSVDFMLNYLSSNHNDNVKLLSDDPDEMFFEFETINCQ